MLLRVVGFYLVTAGKKSGQRPKEKINNSITY